MKAEIINPFMQAAHDVLEIELGTAPTRGNARIERSACTTDEVTGVITVSGAINGLVLYSMSEETARQLVARMLDRQFDQFDTAVRSGVGELGNVITGRAGGLLVAAGYPTNISPPAVVLGKGTLLTTLDLNRLVFPLQTPVGVLEMQVVVKANPTLARVASAA